MFSIFALFNTRNIINRRRKSVSRRTFLEIFRPREWLRYLPSNFRRAGVRGPERGFRGSFSRILDKGPT